MTAVQAKPISSTHEGPMPKGRADGAPAIFEAFNIAADAAPQSIWIDRSKLIQGAPGAKPLANRLFAVKDNIDVVGYATTAACPDFDRKPQRHATLVERLLDAGATLVGKTNLDQFACGLAGTRSPYGEVPNAFRPEYASGGSSSGSAVAVALGLVDFAIGTDTAGSGRVPAGLNNIVGLKPSRGLFSTRGILPACAHIDCPSIFARSVAEAVDVMLALAAHDPEDPFSRRMVLDPRALPARVRIGVPDTSHLQFFGDAQAETAFKGASARLAALGNELSFFDFTPFSQAATALYEDAWVAERYAAIRDFFDQQPESIHPVVRAIIENGKRYSAADLFDAMTRMSACRQQADSLWERFDVLMVPTAPTAYTIAQLQAEPIELNRRLGYYTNAVNLLDLAAIAVPAAMRPDGLPFGITLIGPAGSELRLADLAARFHAGTGLRLGVTQQPIPAARLHPRPAGSTVKVAVVGAHLSGLPLNSQLTDRGGWLLRHARTAPNYRLYALADTIPAKPGLVRVGTGAGSSMDLEIWQLPVTAYGSFVAMIPAPLGIGTIVLEDGERVQGFLCEQEGLQGAVDITSFGGWRAYLAAQATKRQEAATS